MVGKYERKDGSRFDVILTKDNRSGRTYYEMGSERGIGSNRLFYPVDAKEIKELIAKKEITKVE